MRQIFTVLIVLSLLTACTDTVNDARAGIRDWCADNSDYCSMNAVK